jgi:hypothetical protein
MTAGHRGRRDPDEARGAAADEVLSLAEEELPRAAAEQSRGRAGLQPAPHECIAVPVDGADVAGARGILAQRAAQLRHDAGEARLSYAGARPEEVPERFLRHDGGSPSQERTQQVERFGRDGAVVPLASLVIEDPAAEPYLCARHRISRYAVRDAAPFPTRRSKAHFKECERLPKHTAPLLAQLLPER